MKIMDYNSWCLQIDDYRIIMIIMESWNYDDHNDHNGDIMEYHRIVQWTIIK